MTHNNSTARLRRQTPDLSTLAPHTRPVGTRILAIVPTRVAAWSSVGFIVDDSPGDVIRAVVDLHGRVELSYWAPREGHAGEPDARDDRNWVPAIVEDRVHASPVVLTLLDHVSNLSSVEIRAKARALIESEHAERRELLDGYRAAVDDVGRTVDLLERRLAVLDIEDQVEREVALCMIEGWTLSPLELAAAAAGVASDPDIE